MTYTFRQSYLLAGLSVTTFETQHYPYGIRVTQKWDRNVMLTLNARNEHDRSKVNLTNLAIKNNLMPYLLNLLKAKLF